MSHHDVSSQSRSVVTHAILNHLVSYPSTIDVIVHDLHCSYQLVTDAIGLHDSLQPSTVHWENVQNVCRMFAWHSLSCSMMLHSTNISLILLLSFWKLSWDATGCWSSSGNASHPALTLTVLAAFLNDPWMYWYSIALATKFKRFGFHHTS